MKHQGGLSKATAQGGFLNQFEQQCNCDTSK